MADSTNRKRGSGEKAGTGKKAEAGKKAVKAKTAKSAKKTRTSVGKEKTGQKSKAVSAPKPTASEKSERERWDLIAKIGVTSLHDEDIQALVTHCKAVAKFRKSVGTSDQSTAEVESYRCYVKVGNSTIVDIEDAQGNYYGQTTQQEAKARGIKPCG